MRDADDPLVDAARVIPDLIVKLAYATPDNFTRAPLYASDQKCWLRQSAALRLARAAAMLRKQGLRLVARDCTRPPEVQEKLWKAYPHAGAVADPKRGSLHERGVGIDLGLADRRGDPVPVPTGFDDFTPRAHADFPLPEGPAKRNRDALRKAMHANGWRVNPKEWWHFSRLYGWRWPLAHLPH